MTAASRPVLGGALLVAGVLAGAQPARAGCPNVCEISVAPTVVMPGLDCAKFEVTPETCDCGVFVRLTNGCAATLEAIGFAFSSCGAPGGSAATLTQPCTRVDPGLLASMPLRTAGTGAKHWPLTLRQQGTDYTATVAATVTSFDSGCALSGAAAGARSVPGDLVVLALLLVPASRRARHRLQARRSLTI